jgi:hypothetical protein
MRAAAFAAASLALTAIATALPYFPALIPNGARVASCKYLGHMNCISGSARNQVSFDPIPQSLSAYRCERQIAVLTSVNVHIGPHPFPILHRAVRPRFQERGKSAVE